MFVGAGPHQLKGIVRAKNMGLFVIASDGNSEAPGFGVADLPYVVNVKDKEANLKIARENAIDGVLSIASEVSIKTVAYISQVIGLPGINSEVAHKCTDKEQMRKAFHDAGLPGPESEVAFSLEELFYKADKIGFPVVVKPADSAGSRGVNRVDNKNGLKRAFLGAMKYSGKQKILVEAFLDGVESSVEAFVHDKDIHILTLSDKVRTPPPHLLDTTVIFPSAHPKAIQEQMVEMMVKAISGIGINLGPVHFEFMLTDDGPVPVELAARGPGFKVFTDIIPRITGIDILGELIKCALSEKPDLRKNKDLASVLKFIETKPGKIKKISGTEEAKKIEGVCELEIYLKEGDTVNSLTCGDDRIGHFISFANTREEAVNIAREVERMVIIETEK